MSKLSYKTLFTIFFFLLIGVIVLSKFVLPNQKVSAAWWNDMWMYRKAISISNTSGSNLTDFQVSLSVGTSALIASGKMQSDCDDIRVTDINGNLLAYWIEENNPGCNQITDTKIWIKASSLPTSGSTVYLYYGNASATNNQNGNNVFEFFDDFNGNLNKWTREIRGSGGSVNISEGEAILSPTPNTISSANIKSVPTFTNNIVIELRRKQTTNTNYMDFTFASGTLVDADNGATNSWWHTSAKNGYFWNYQPSTSDGLYRMPASGGKITLNSGAISINTSFYAIHKMIYGPSGELYWFVDNTQKRNATDTTFLSDQKNIIISQGEYTNGDGDTQYIDYIFVHKYASTDPTPTLQSEETGTAPIAYWKFDEGVGTTAYDSTSNQNNGVVSGDWKTEDQCVSEKCLASDGTHGYTNVGTGLNSYFTNQNFTIESWINPARLNGADVTNYEIFGNESYQSYGILFRLDINGTPGALSFRTSQSGTAQATYSSRITVANTWYHVAAVRNGASVRIYINGKDQTSSAGNHINPTLSATSIKIGGGGQYFNGKLDDTKIYSYARTAAQIKLDYNAGKAHASSTEGTSTSLGSNKNNGDLSDGLVGYWKMDEGVGTSIADSSGTGYTGTFGTGSSSPAWSSGKFGVGTSFDGSNDYINFGNPGLSSLSNSTISFWRKAVSASAWLLFQGQDGNYYILATSGTGAFYHANIGSATKIYVDGNLATTPLTDNNWHHYVITGVNLSGWTNLNLSNYPNFHYNGQIDEIRLYNRALSSSEVSDLYNYAPGPVGYWDFNDGSGAVAKDKSGNGLNGNIAGSAVWKSGGYCKIGGCLTLDHIDDRVTVNHSSLLEPSSITVEGWVKLNSTGDRQILFTKWSGYSLEISATGYPYFRLNGATPYDLYSSKAINWGQWHYVAATLDNTTKQETIFLDGISVGSTISTGNISYNQGTLAFPYSNATYGNGLIDEFKIYNYARTQKQIIEDMTAGASVVSSKSMIAYYKFDEGNGTTAYNFGVGGTTLNGTIAGATWTNNGKFGKALSLNGNNYIGPININPWIRNSEYITITGWYYHNADTQGAPWGIMTTTTPPDQDGFWWHIKYPGNILYLRTEDNVHGESDGTGVSFVSSSNWYYLATIIGTNKVKIYVNGKIYWDWTPNNGFSWSNVNSDPAYLYLGSSYSTTAGINGMLDEVKLYNYALTDEEIKQDYNQGSATSFGQTTQTIGATTTSLDYCIPGDTSYCASPVAEYKMDEGVGTSAFDTSGNNLSAGFSGTAPAWVQGKIGKGLRFDGIDDRLTLNSSVNLNGNANWTVSAWVKTSSSGSNPIISNKAGGPVYNDLRVFNSKMSYYHYNGAWINETGNINIANGQWNYLTWVNHSNQTIDMYVNGIADTLAVSSSLSGSGPVDQIGRDWTTSSNATIDHVKVYNYVRTPAQIAYDYNKGGPVGWWKFDECQGNIAYDWSGIGNSGTIIIGASGTQNSLGTCQVGTSAAWTAGSSGHTNSSLNFDGTDDYINIGNTIPFTTSMSLSAWVFPTLNPSSYGGFLSTENHTTLTGISMWFRNNKFYFGQSHNSRQYTDNINRDINNWYLATVTYDNGNYSFYLNGRKTQSVTGVGTTLNNTITIGRLLTSYTGGYYFPGQIDDVRIYNYALTSEQIKILYNGGSVSFN